MWYRLKKNTRMPKPKPCPCCGNTNLYTGHLSSNVLGVCCWRYGNGCNLRIEHAHPYDDEVKQMLSLAKKYKWPIESFMPKKWAGVSSKKLLDASDRVVLYIAIMKWNRRVKSISQD